MEGGMFRMQYIHLWVCDDVSHENEDFYKDVSYTNDFLRFSDEKVYFYVVL